MKSKVSSKKKNIIIVSIFAVIILILGTLFLYNGTKLKDNSYNATGGENFITIKSNETMNLKEDSLYVADSYKVDKEDVVTVDEDGNLKGLKSGIAQIQKLKDGKVVGTITVYVDEKDVSIARIDSADFTFKQEEYDDTLYVATKNIASKSDYCFIIYAADKTDTIKVTSEEQELKSENELVIQQEEEYGKNGEISICGNSPSKTYYVTISNGDFVGVYTIYLDEGSNSTSTSSSTNTTSTSASSSTSTSSSTSSTKPTCPEITTNVKENEWTSKNVEFKLDFTNSNAVSYDWFTATQTSDTKYIWYLWSIDSVKKANSLTLKVIDTTSSKLKNVRRNLSDNTKICTNRICNDKISGNGVRKINVRVYGNNGKYTDCFNTNKYYIDKNTPSVPKISAKVKNSSGKSIDLTKNTSYGHRIYIEKLTATDSLSGVSKYQFKECGKNNVYDLSTNWGNLTININNSFCRQFRTVDKVGNTSDWSTPYYAKVRKPKVLVIAGHTYEPDCKNVRSVSGENNCRKTITYKNNIKIKETTVNRDYSKKLINELKKVDIDVTYANAALGETNTKNSKTLWSEIRTANTKRYNALKKQFKDYDYAIEIHMNALGTSSAGGRSKGANILYNTKSGPTTIDKAVAKSVRDIMGNGGTSVNTVNWEDQKFFRELNIPFTYLEAEFYTNESAILKFVSKEDQIAQSMAKAIKNNLW